MRNGLRDFKGLYFNAKIYTGEIFVTFQMDENPKTTVTLDCIPISMDANQGLETSEVIDYSDEAATTHKEFLNCTVNPPVQPNGGTVFLLI